MSTSVNYLQVAINFAFNLQVTIFIFAHKFLMSWLYYYCANLRQLLAYTTQSLGFPEFWSFMYC